MSHQENTPVEKPIESNNTRSGRTGRGGQRRGGRQGRSGGRTMHTYISTSIKDISINQSVERNYYILDLATIFLCFIQMEDIINQLPTRPAWPDYGYMTGMFCYVLAGRLQRVAMATNQIMFNPDEMLRYDHIKIPESIAAIIESFGEVCDIDDVILIPKVTRGLIIWLADTADALFRQTNNAAGLMVHNNIDDESTLRPYLGDDVYFTYCYLSVASELRRPGPILGVSPDHRNALFTYLQVCDLHSIGAVIGAPVIGVSFPIPAAAVLVHDNCFTAGGAIPAAGAGYSAGLVAALTSVRNDNVYAVAPLKVNAPVIVALAGHSFDLLPLDCETLFIQLSMKLRCRYVNQDHHGTLAPLVFGDDDDNRDFAVGKTVVRAVSPEEFFLGAIMNRRVIFISRENVFYNVESPKRRGHRYQTSQFPLSLG